MSGRRRKGGYFTRRSTDPAPLVTRLRRRVGFGETDVMGVAWHGNYAAYFEQGSAELGRRCGLSYQDYFDNDLRAPIVQLHVDYLHSLRLDEEFTIVASLIWTDGARLDTEYLLLGADKRVATSGFTVQMFIRASTGEPCITVPDLVERCRRRWRTGQFGDLV